MGSAANLDRIRRTVGSELRIPPTILPPKMPQELPRHGWAMLAPFAGEEVRPVGGGCEAFAVGGAELEEHREAAFAEAGMLFKRPALMQFHLSFRGSVEVGDFGGALVQPRDGEWQQLIQPTD